MSQTKEEIKQTLQEDLQKFKEQVEFYKTHKFKLLTPKGQQDCIASAAIVAYLTERLKLFEED